MDTKRRTTFAWALLALLTLAGLPAPAQESPPYQMPPQAIADIVDAAGSPRVIPSPDARTLLIVERPPLIAIADLLQPELRLAGLRINPRSNGPSLSRAEFFRSIAFRDLATLKERPLSGLPDGARVSDLQWSPDGARLAFTITGSDGIELWQAAAADGRAVRLLGPRLNAAMPSACYQWLPDSRGLLCRLVPQDRPALAPKSVIPRGPIVQESAGRAAPVRTYQDLLQDAYDEEAFTHYATSQLAEVDLQGNVRRIGAPAIITLSDSSPDGAYILVTIVQRPFSYLVPCSGFPQTCEIWNRDGDQVRKIADLELSENVPPGFDAVRRGPRDFSWRGDAPATLYWVEAQDGGDPARAAEIRDQVFSLAAPFVGQPRQGPSLPYRLRAFTWGSGSLALLSHFWWKTRQVRVERFAPDSPAPTLTTVFAYSQEDRYNDPGSFFTRVNAKGRRVLLVDRRGQLYLGGLGASPEGDRPFIDRFDPASGKKTRLWRSAAPHYERTVAFVDADRGIVLSSREGRKTQPNYFLRRLDSGRLKQVTFFPHPFPALKEVEKQLIRYRRADGVELSGSLYLPPGWKKGDSPLPVLMWAYPQEFKSRQAAGQVQDSPYRFMRISPYSTLVWITQGYAVLDNPAMPIVGEGQQEPNDTYIEQLVAGAQAAVDKLVEMGVGDRGRMAVGGHSYGAFMTANLLAHSRLFAAGIARSGAYNRTLTPFGFQAEERLLWQAADTYLRMSPFMNAHQVKDPLLLIHGQADDNSGTFPLQSERFYHALKGNGATARLVLLPGESHGYDARESILHMLWETWMWLEAHVKSKPAASGVQGR